MDVLKVGDVVALFMNAFPKDFYTGVVTKVKNKIVTLRYSLDGSTEDVAVYLLYGKVKKEVKGPLGRDETDKMIISYLGRELFLRLNKELGHQLDIYKSHIVNQPGDTEHFTRLANRHIEIVQQYIKDIANAGD